MGVGTVEEGRLIQSRLYGRVAQPIFHLPYFSRSRGWWSNGKRNTRLTLLIMRCMMVLGMRSLMDLLTMLIYESTRLRMVSTCRSSCGSMDTVSLGFMASSLSGWTDRDRDREGDVRDAVQTWIHVLFVWSVEAENVFSPSDCYSEWWESKLDQFWLYHKGKSLCLCAWYCLEVDGALLEKCHLLLSTNQVEYTTIRNWWELFVLPLSIKSDQTTPTQSY